MANLPLGERVRLVVGCLIAQAIVAAAVELPYGGGDLVDVLAVLAFVLVILAMAALARTATPLARTTLLIFEGSVLSYGLYQLVFQGAYLGATIFAGGIMVILLHPAVVRAYGSGRARGPLSGTPRPVPETGAPPEPPGGLPPPTPPAASEPARDQEMPPW